MVLIHCGMFSSEATLSGTKTVQKLCGFQYNWGEPGRAPHRRHGCLQSIFVCLLFGQDGSMDIIVKNSCAHSHAWVAGHSNLTNSKFTLV